MPKGARRKPERLAEKLCHIRHRLKLTQEELKERLEQLGFVSDLTHGNHPYGNGPFQFITLGRLPEVTDLKEPIANPRSSYDCVER